MRNIHFTRMFQFVLVKMLTIIRVIIYVSPELFMLVTFLPIKKMSLLMKDEKIGS